jgi:very-short-patch-repair endonuclease
LNWKALILTDSSSNGLIAILNAKTDLAILQEQGWYRIPVASAPKPWPPKWLAFYQTKVFGKDAYSIRYYGEVEQAPIVRRCDLFPNEPPNPKSDREYHQVRLRSLEPLKRPILSRRLRRVVFISTTWEKLQGAVEINDLFHASPLEDQLWAELQKLQIGAAERQWLVTAVKSDYVLDFAVFCCKRNLDIEADGDTYHVTREQAPKDNRRNNDLNLSSWDVLRFTGHQIREQMATYCLPTVRRAIRRLGGLSDEGLVSRVFHDS